MLAGGARCLQLRAKSQWSGAFLPLIDAVVGVARRSGALVIVNDRVDLARLGNAGGVHLGQDDLPATDARVQLGSAALIGLSTHTAVQLRAAASEPVDYVAIGPVFDTATKDTGYEALGLEAVAMARRIVPADIAIVAIGGITLENAPAAIRAGADSVAVIGDLLVGNPEARVTEYVTLLS